MVFSIFSEGTIFRVWAQFGTHDFWPKMGKISPPVKSWVSAQKAGGEKISVFLWELEDFVESSNSMKSRGYSLKGRTAFSIYRFDNRDRGFVIAFFACLTFVMMAVLFNQTNIYYNPQIVMNRITFMSYIFYAAYAIFLLLPLGLQIVGEWRFEKLRKKA